MPAILNWLLRLGPTNPICMRLVYGGSRRLRHLYIRAGYLAVMIVVLLFMLIGQDSGALSMRELARTGAVTFAGISYFQVLLICLLTPIFMAGAIAQEANPNTWNILLTTPLNSAQIVLGNLLGRLFFILALLFSTLPLFAVTQFFGGVPGRDIFASYAIAGSIALLVASIAITLSVTRTAGRRAVFVFYVVIVLYLFVTYALDLQLRLPVTGAAAGVYHTTVLTPLNPFLALEVLLQSNTYVPPDLAGTGAIRLQRWWMETPVSTFCWLCVAISVVMLTISTARLRVIGANVGTIPWYRRLLGLGARDATERPARAVSNNPIVWREATARGHTLAGVIMRWGFMVLGVALAVAVLSLYHTSAFSHHEFQISLLTIVTAEVVVVTLAALNTSATAVSREREDGTLDIILTTPIQPGPYLYGKLRGLVQFLLPMMLVPILTMALAGLYVLSGGLGRSGGITVQQPIPGATGSFELPVVLPEAALTMPLVLVPFLAFAVMIGLQWSIKSRGTIGSVVAAVAVLLTIMAVISGCAMAAGRSIPYLGAVMTSLSPINLAWAMVFPASVVPETARTDLSGMRVSLVVGAAFAGIAFAAIVYGMHTGMKRSFMMTVRRLAGTT